MPTNLSSADIRAQLATQEKHLVNMRRLLLEAETAELRATVTADERRVAELLHEKLCHWNHTDGCSWHYENWDNVEKHSGRGEYLKKARAIIAAATEQGVTVEQLIPILTAIK